MQQTAGSQLIRHSNDVHDGSKNTQVKNKVPTSRGANMTGTQRMVLHVEKGDELGIYEVDIGAGGDAMPKDLKDLRHLSILRVPLMAPSQN